MAATVEQLMEAATKGQAGLGLLGSTRDGSALTLDLPFQWDTEKGDAKFSGTSPAKLTLTAGYELSRTNLNVKYAVDLSAVPAVARDLVKESVIDTVRGSGPMWQASKAETLKDPTSA